MHLRIYNLIKMDANNNTKYDYQFEIRGLIIPNGKVNPLFETSFKQFDNWCQRLNYVEFDSCL